MLLFVLADTEHSVIFSIIMIHTNREIYVNCTSLTVQINLTEHLYSLWEGRLFKIRFQKYFQYEEKDVSFITVKAKLLNAVAVQYLC